ncbi:unnamed protein product [Thelazia callipaeda]|uniref:EFTUD2 domain-containing protein n=1 Tax=Thelazia callipaeda TaxID=103827 RepID=A0A0N5D7B3_THECL|nr:unnamed protein product [Thelazia callipaeda]
MDGFAVDDIERYCNVEMISTALKEECESPGDSECDEEMELDSINSQISSDVPFSDDDGSDEDEYPEFIRNGGESAIESESYDFAVMDTERDALYPNRKRKVNKS